MATVDTTHHVQSPEEYSQEISRARSLAERYRLEFVDMNEFRIDQDLFRSIPADLMLRYGFVPHRREGRGLVIVVSDPTDLPMIDELGVILATPIKVTVRAPSAIQSILKKSESSQRVLENATEGVQLKVVKEDEAGEEAVHVKYRIDGVLQPAMRPIAREFHSPIISRIKVMAELDIAEKRVPQDGRFRMRMPGKTIDFRVSIMPSVHGE